GQNGSASVRDDGRPVPAPRLVEDGHAVEVVGVSHVLEVADGHEPAAARCLRQVEHPEDAVRRWCEGRGGAGAGGEAQEALAGVAVPAAVEPRVQDRPDELYRLTVAIGTVVVPVGLPVGVERDEAIAGATGWRWGRSGLGTKGD